MKSRLLLLSLLLIPVTLISQKQFSSVELGKYFAEKLAIIPDNEGLICVYSRDYKNHNFSIINAEGKLVRTKIFKRSSIFNLAFHLQGLRSQGMILSCFSQTFKIRTGLTLYIKFQSTIP